jgi:hypothetical protein
MQRDSQQHTLTQMQSADMTLLKSFSEGGARDVTETLSTNSDSDEGCKAINLLL